MNVRIWNAWWEDALGGFMNAWKGNAGFLTEPDPDGSLWLRCSDGIGDPNFTDLVVRVDLQRHQAD
jgi:hypothetical protein